MGRGRLIVTEQEHARSLDRCETEFVSPLEFARLARNGHWLKRIAGYRETGLIAAQPWLRPRLFALVLLLWLLGRGNCWLQDLNGKVARVRFATLLCLLGNLLRDAAAVPWALHCVRREVRELQAWAQLPRLSGRLGAARPLYLKTDLWFETLAGGSVSHMAGVINHMPEYFAAPLVLATACNPLLRENFEFKQILPECRYWDFRDLPSLMFSSHLRKTVELACGERAPGFIYQRCNLNNYAALWLARDWGVPLISEYNGSEVWIENHWGGRRNGNRLSEAIERLNLDAADLIVVVSNALQDELTHIGIPASRILVNPSVARAADASISGR